MYEAAERCDAELHLHRQNRFMNEFARACADDVRADEFIFAPRANELAESACRFFRVGAIIVGEGRSINPYIICAVLPSRFLFGHARAQFPGL